MLVVYSWELLVVELVNGAVELELLATGLVVTTLLLTAPLAEVVLRLMEVDVVELLK